MKARNPNTGNFEKLYVKALDSLPVGASVEYAGTTIPDELKGTWLFERGQELSRTEYVKLFSVIGTSYGVGDGSTTFNLPNKCGRVPVGLDENDTDFNTIGKTDGEKEHILKINEIPPHNHPMKYALNSREVVTTNYGSVSPRNDVTWTDDNIIQTTGGGQAHNNLQPYIVKNYIIKVKETRPLASHTVNAYSESESNAYSTNYINNINKYSTSETFTGKYWEDNKPIYRRVIKGTTYSTDSISYYADIEFDLETLTHSEGYITRTGENSMPINTVIWDGNNDLVASSRLEPLNSPSSGVRLLATKDKTWVSYSIIVEYTKTTD